MRPATSHLSPDLSLTPDGRRAESAPGRSSRASSTPLLVRGRARVCLDEVQVTDITDASIVRGLWWATCSSTLTLAIDH
eukprot:scaffold21555_cov66-Phaeocystis_antarctica.AAC.8